jgi:hypothetical protein
VNCFEWIVHNGYYNFHNFLTPKCGLVHDLYGLRDSSLAVEIERNFVLILIGILVWSTHAPPSLTDPFISSMNFIWCLYFSPTWWDLDSTAFAVEVWMLWHRLLKDRVPYNMQMLMGYGPLHTRDWGPVTIILQALSLVEKPEPVQVRFTLRLRDQRSMWMQDGCK